MAGDGKTTISSIRRSSSNRHYVPSSRSNLRSNFTIEPAPIILEIGSTILRVGYAEQFQPQHLIAMERPIFDDPKSINQKPTTAASTTTVNKTKTESEWYLLLAPLIEQVYDRLMCKPSARRVVCVYKPYAPVAFQNALKQHLWNQGVPAQVHLDYLQVLPLANGWKRGLIVHVSREETICACYADGYVIRYTYQIVPRGYHQILLVSHHKTIGTGTGGNPSTSTAEMPTSQENLDAAIQDCTLNDYDPRSSLVLAILMCLQECPIDLRSHVVSNLVFGGDGVALLPDLPRAVAKKVEQFLQRPSVPDESLGESSVSSLSYSPKDTTMESIAGIPHVNDSIFSLVPLDRKSLQPLAERLTLKSCAPVRADWVSWVGASLWAATWNKYDQDETPIPWQFPTLSQEATS